VQIESENNSNLFLCKFHFYFATAKLPVSGISFLCTNIVMESCFSFSPQFSEHERSGHFSVFIIGLTSRICEAAKYETATLRDDPMHHLLSNRNYDFSHKVYL
jgi:hypothetical protein